MVAILGPGVSYMIRDSKTLYLIHRTDVQKLDVTHVRPFCNVCVNLYKRQDDVGLHAFISEVIT